MAATTYAGIMQAIPDAEPEAIRNEVFALAGYKSAQRFFTSENSPTMAVQQQNQELQAQLQELAQKLQEAELKLQDKEVDNIISAYDAETKRMALMKPDAPQPVEQEPAVDIELLKEEFKAAVQERLEAMKLSNDQEKQLMSLAAEVIKAQLTKPAPQQSGEDVSVRDVAPAETRETLEKMMSAIENLAMLVKAPRERTIIRDESGRAFKSRETIELNSMQ
jgi:hypothetical protein